MFEHNTLTFDVDKPNIFNNIKMGFFNISPRHFTINVDSNTFLDMNDAHKVFVDVEFYAHGEISVSDNFVRNSSSHLYQFRVSSDDHTVANNNTFTN